MSNHQTSSHTKLMLIIWVKFPQQLLQREYELTELKSENGQTSIQVYAMVDPEVGITYALKVSCVHTSA